MESYLSSFIIFLSSCIVKRSTIVNNVLFCRIKKSLEDPGNSEPEEHRDEPNTFQESYDDINVDHLLSNFQLVGFLIFKTVVLMTITLLPFVISYFSSEILDLVQI